MARGFSKAIIMGNLTRDPEMRITPNGASVCSFAVAVNRTYRDGTGNNVEQVSFLDCSAWGKLGETIAQYAKKGSGVLISGRLEQRSWEDKATGQKRSRVEIVVEDFNFLPRGTQGQGASAGSYGASAPASAGASEVVPEDIPDEVDLGDIPF